MTTQKTFTTVLTEFAEFIGQQDKEMLKIVDEKLAQLKNDLLGGDVAAELDTIKELADALNNLKSGESMPDKLIQKITEFKGELDNLSAKLTALDGVDLKAAYLKGKNG